MSLDHCGIELTEFRFVLQMDNIIIILIIDNRNIKEQWGLYRDGLSAIALLLTFHHLCKSLRGNNYFFPISLLVKEPN